jgi:hypothetical protein
MKLRQPIFALAAIAALAAAPAEARHYQTCDYVDATGVDMANGDGMRCGAGYTRFLDTGQIQCKTISIAVPGNERILSATHAKGNNDWSAFEDNVNIERQGSGTLVSTTLRNWSENLRTQFCLYVETDG